MKAMVAMLLVGVLTPVAALAQAWQIYTYPEPGFSIQFPATPTVEKGRIKNATGASLPMTRFVARQDNIVYTLSVVNYAGTNADSISTIRDTEISLGKSGTMTATTGVRINKHVGREVSLTGSDGTQSDIAIFYVDKHLYIAASQALTPSTGGVTADASRFQKSLSFDDDGGGGLGGFFSSFLGGGSPKVGPTVTPAPVAPAPVPPPAVAALPVAPPAAPLAAAPPVAATPAAHIAPGPHTDAACAGKSDGDVVQLQTPSGPVTATCTLTLIARPNATR